MLAAALAILCPLVDPFVPKTYLIDGDRWTTVAKEKPYLDHPGARERYLTFSKNGRVAFLVSGEEMSAWNLEAFRAWWPVPWPVFVVVGTTANGHGLTMLFLSLQHGELKKVLFVWGLHGGPIFRDFDGDGLMEWVFDNTEWYDQHVPDRFLVFKLNAKGTLELWKSLPNLEHKHVPSPWFIDY